MTKTRYWMRVYQANGDSKLFPALVYSDQDAFGLLDREIPAQSNTKKILFKQHAGDSRIFFCLSWVDSAWRFLDGLNLEEARADLEELL